VPWRWFSWWRLTFRGSETTRSTGGGRCGTRALICALERFHCPPWPLPPGIERKTRGGTKTQANEHCSIRVAPQVFFYKRAQIFAGDLYGAFRGRGLGEFTDLDQITTFPDYRRVRRDPKGDRGGKRREEEGRI
jgi:hypothetical protein